jgi:hypothetical protein
VPEMEYYFKETKEIENQCKKVIEMDLEEGKLF